MYIYICTVFQGKTASNEFMTTDRIRIIIDCSIIINSTRASIRVKHTTGAAGHQP